MGVKKKPVSKKENKNKDTKESGGRKATGSRKKFVVQPKDSDDDLIAAIQKRPILWKKDDPEYPNTHKSALEWQAAASEAGFARLATFKNRWKRLKESFVLSHQQIPRKRSGDGAATHHRVSWPLYYPLKFLKDYVLPAQSTGNLSTIAGSSDYESDVDERRSVRKRKINRLPDYDYSSEESGSDNNERPDDDSDEQSGEDSAEEFVPETQDCDPKPPTKKQRLTKTDKFHNELLSSEKEKVNIFKKILNNKEKPPLDPYGAFFTTLKMYLSKMNDEQKARCQTELVQIAVRYAYNVTTWEPHSKQPKKKGKSTSITDVETLKYSPNLPTTVDLTKNDEQSDEDLIVSNTLDENAKTNYYAPSPSSLLLPPCSPADITKRNACQTPQQRAEPANPSSEKIRTSKVSTQTNNYEAYKKNVPPVVPFQSSSDSTLAAQGNLTNQVDNRINSATCYSRYDRRTVPGLYERESDGNTTNFNLPDSLTKIPETNLCSGSRTMLYEREPSQVSQTRPNNASLSYNYSAYNPRTSLNIYQNDPSRAGDTRSNYAFSKPSTHTSDSYCAVTPSRLDTDSQSQMRQVFGNSCNVNAAGSSEYQNWASFAPDMNKYQPYQASSSGYTYDWTSSLAHDPKFQYSSHKTKTNAFLRNSLSQISTSTSNFEIASSAYNNTMLQNPSSQTSTSTSNFITTSSSACDNESYLSSSPYAFNNHNLNQSANWWNTGYPQIPDFTNFVSPSPERE